MTDLDPEFEKVARKLAAQYGPILGGQRASLGAERFMRFTAGHATVQAMAFFLVMSVATAPQSGYADEALDAILSDIKDLRDATDEWTKTCRELVKNWRAQRQEGER